MNSFIQTILGWRFFSRREKAYGVFEIIAWWELRRIPYNLVVGATGILTIVIIATAAWIASQTFGDPVEFPDPPLFAFMAVIAYGVCANICYTGGWIAELVARWVWKERVGAFAQISFVLGFVFSILLTLVPALLIVCALGARLVFR